MRKNKRQISEHVSNIMRWAQKDLPCIQSEVVSVNIFKNKITFEGFREGIKKRTDIGRNTDTRALQAVMTNPSCLFSRQTGLPHLHMTG